MKQFFKKLLPAKQSAPTKQTRKSSAAPAVDILKGLMSNLPIRGRWLSRFEIDSILRDATVISSLGSRKAATLKKELLFTCDDETLYETLYSVFSPSVMRKILDAPFQGISVFEINWIDAGNLLIPRLIERNFEEFIILNEVLYYAPYGALEEIPEFKAVHTVYEDKYHRPMGTPLYESLFWYVKFKNASLEFWIKFLEKYGVPWAIGKTDGDKNEMAEEIYAMLSGDSAVIDPEDEIDIKTVDKIGDFDKITAYLDDQIREAILGGNLTGNVKGGSFAAAQTHNDIREDIAMADENMTLSLIEKVLRYFIDINALSFDIEVVLKDKDDPNTELAARDVNIVAMGYKPTQEYVERTYNITVEPIDTTKVANRALFSKLISLSATKPMSTTDELSDSLNLKKIALSFQNQIVDIVDKAKSFEEAIDLLHDAYPSMDIAELQDTMDMALQSSYILGSAEVEYESDEE